MNKSDSIKNIVAAIIAVSNEVKHIDKAMTIGTGSNAYKGVSDESVKSAIGAAMNKQGLSIVPVSINPTVKIERWEEFQKQKQLVFTEVQTLYLLMHNSGEWIEIAGYGHGTDSQDKAAGKATTYALKYALLYTFMVPTKKIDDTDNEHSESKPTPPPASDNRPWLNENTDEFNRIKAALAKVEDKAGALKAFETRFKISKQTKEKLIS